MKKILFAILLTLVLSGGASAASETYRSVVYNKYYGKKYTQLSKFKNKSVKQSMEKCKKFSTGMEMQCELYMISHNGEKEYFFDYSDIRQWMEHPNNLPPPKYTKNNNKNLSFTLFDKKENCIEIGYSPSSNEFANCVLKLVELDLKSQFNEESIKFKTAENKEIVSQLKNQNNLIQSKFLYDLSQQLLNSNSKAGSNNVTSCTVTGLTVKNINCF